MKHKQFKQWLQLSLYDELSDEEKDLLNKHLDICDECRMELGKLKKLHGILANYQPQQVNEELLQQARKNLQLKLQADSTHKSLWQNVRNLLNDILTPKVQIAIGGAAMIAVGILIGYFAFELPADKSLKFLQTSSSSTVMEAGESQVINIRFINRDVQTGNIEFRFETITPMHVRGNISDENVQKVLARALMSEQNIGTRLRTVGMLGKQSDNTYDRNIKLEKEIKSALITVLLRDENLGVRREALNVLKQYLPDADIVRALLTIIKKEKNVNLKTAAINALDLSAYQNQPLNKEIIEVLKNTAQSDENNYIRIKAKTTLQEIQQ